MTRNKIFLIAGLGAILFFFIVAQFFEIKNVPDVKWSKNYELDSKEPYGGWMFEKMLHARFNQADLVYHYKDTLISEIDTSGALLVKFGNTFYTSDSEVEELYAFVQAGNQVIYIGEHINFYNDSIYIPSSYKNHKDSVFSFSFIEDSLDSSFVYKHYSRDFEAAEIYYHGGFKKWDLDDSRYLGLVNDSLYTFVSHPLGDGEIFVHLLPILFSNHASLEDFYLAHFNRVFARFNPELVILDHPSLNKYRANYNNPDGYNESPIQYVLSQKSLSSAYYLLLFAALLFIIFKSKRKQRPIPILEKNINTSLEYVETLANLFASQEQSVKLIPHIKNYFYHTVKTRYYLDERHPDFVALLAKKSKVNEEELEVLIKMLNRSGDAYAFPDDQLINLHRRVEKFYKIAK